MDKTITKTLTGAVAATTLGLGVTTVYGDETAVLPSSTTELKSVRKTDTGTENKGNVVTQEQVKEAQDHLNSSIESVKHAQGEVDQAQGEVDQAQEGVKKAQQKKNDATPENITNQKRVIASSKERLNEATEAATQSQDKLDQSKGLVSTQEEVVKKAQLEVEEGQSHVKDAQKRVKSAQDILDGTGQADIIAEKENAEKVQKQAQTYVEKKLEDLSAAQKHDQDLAQSIVDAEGVLQQATSKAKGTESTLDKAKEQAQRTHDALEQAQSVFEKTENDYNSINTFKFTDDYVNALKMYAQSPYDILTQYDLWSKHNSEQKIKLQQANQENIGLNKYKSNLNDKKIIVDPNNLTKEQITELSLFASDLLNQIRERFGTNKTVVSSGMIEVAKKVATGYVTDNWKFGSGHDNRAVNDVAREYGLPAPSGNTGQNLENLNSINDGNLIHNMDDAKKWIYESLSDLLFNGYEWLHAESITGLSSKSLGTKDYFALGLSKRDGVTSSHWLSVADGQISGTKFNKTEIPNPKSSEAITRAYNAAKTNLNLAQTNNFIAQQEKTEAATANIVANGEKENAQKRLNELKDTSLEVPNAEVQLKNAQKELQKANKRFEDAQKALENLTADVKIKEQNLKDAKDLLDSAQNALTNATGNLEQEQNTLMALQERVQTDEQNLKLSKTKVDEATEELQKAEAYLEDLLNAEPNLKKAKDILTAKESDLRQKQTILKEKQAILNNLLEEQKANEDTYNKISLLYTAQIEAERLANLEAQKQAILDAGKTPVEVYDETGKLVSYMVKSKNIISQSTVSYNSSWTQKQGENLPNTGEQTSMSALAGWSILALLGLAVGKRKRKEQVWEEQAD